MKKTFLLLTVGIMLCFALTLPASALTLEQVQASPPKFDIYVHGEGVDLSEVKTADVKAALGGSPLNCTGISRSEQGIFYVFMLDISASIPPAHFEAAKEAVLSTYSTLREQDKMAVITFGSEVNLLLSGGEDEDEVRSAVSSLYCNDNQTMFYTAMDKLIETATQVRDMRRIAVVISDGIDDSDAGMTQAELEDKLINCGISVYAMCIDSSSQANIDNFGSFIRLSGGELFTFGPDTAQAVLDTLPARLYDSLHIELMSRESIPGGEDLELNVQLGEFGSVSALLSSGKWTPDETSPYIESAVFSIENKTLDIVFSEPVSGADNVANYTLTDVEGNMIAIGSAAYTSAELSSVSLSFDVLPVEGQYKLTAGGICDLSLEANELQPYTGSVMLATGIRGESETDSRLPKDVIIYIIAGVVALALAAFLAAAIVRMSKKKNGSKLRSEEKNKAKKARSEPKPREERFIFTNQARRDKDGK